MKQQRNARPGRWPILLMIFLGFLLTLPLAAQEVTLSLDRFHELWKKAHPPEPEPAKPTGSLALESAELAVVVDGEVARLTTTLEVSLAGEVWQTLALPALGPVLAVEASGVEVESKWAEGKPVLKLKGAGRHRIRVESALPAVTQEAVVALERRLDLPLPRAASVTGTLAVGPEVQQVHASAGGLVFPQEAGRYRFVGEPGAGLVLWLSGAPAVAPKKALAEPLVLEAETASALAASRARLRLTSWIGLRVVSGELEGLRFPLPAGFEVLSVSGPRLVGWELVDGRLELALSAAARGALAFEVQLAADPSLELAPPVLLPEGARLVRSAVKVALRSPDGLLETVARHGAEPVADDELARWGPGFRDAPGEPLLLAAGEPLPRWKVTWAQSGEVLSAQIDRLVVDAVVGESGMARMRLWAEIRNGEPSLDLTVPPGARLVRALRDRRPVTVGESGGTWVVPMVVQAAPQVVYLEALLAVPFPSQGGQLTLPLPRLSVPTSRVEVRLLAPPGFDVRLPSGVSADSVASPPGGGTRLVSAPGPEGFLAPPLGFSTLETSWSAWSAEPPPVVFTVHPRSTRRSR